MTEAKLKDALMLRILEAIEDKFTGKQEEEEGRKLESSV